MSRHIHIYVKKARDHDESFGKLKNQLAHKKGVHDPAALAAYIGRKDLGKKAFQRKAAEGRKK
jgi:hypothetical protein